MWKKAAPVALTNSPYSHHCSWVCSVWLIFPSRSQVQLVSFEMSQNRFQIHRAEWDCECLAILCFCHNGNWNNASQCVVARVKVNTFWWRGKHLSFHTWTPRANVPPTLDQLWIPAGHLTIVPRYNTSVHEFYIGHFHVSGSEVCLESANSRWIVDI